MTLLEKIKNYKWFDSPNKLKPILEELYNSIGGGSGGGSQDLQSVLDNWNTAQYDDGNSTSTILGGTTNSRFTTFDVSNTTPEFSVYSLFQENIDGVKLLSSCGDLATGDLNTGTINIGDVLFDNMQTRGNISLSQEYSSMGSIKSTTVGFETPIGAPSVLKFPAKPSGTYTLATLDNIKKIDLTGRVYANNAAAITGGLTTNDVYRTSTGELRIVV